VKRIGFLIPHSVWMRDFFIRTLMSSYTIFDFFVNDEKWYKFSFFLTIILLIIGGFLFSLGYNDVSTDYEDFNHKYGEVIEIGIVQVKTEKSYAQGGGLKNESRLRIKVDDKEFFFGKSFYYLWTDILSKVKKGDEIKIVYKNIPQIRQNSKAFYPENRVLQLIHKGDEIISFNNFRESSFSLFVTSIFILAVTIVIAIVLIVKRKRIHKSIWPKLA
jgi:hypothetical protein